MSKNRVKYYLKGTFVLIIIFGLILVSFYAVATSSNRTIFFIIFFSIMGATIIAYWIYAFLRERKIARMDPEEKESKNKPIYKKDRHGKK